MSIRVLVTNDDGVQGPGIHVLAAALRDASYDVLVVAPDNDRSGSGAAGRRLTRPPRRRLEAVHVVPDASAPYSLHRPLHAGAIPAER